MATLRHSTVSGKDVTVAFVRQYGGVVKFNADGSIECTEKYHCLYSLALSLAPVRNVTAHPIYTGLYCQDITITERPALMAEVTVTYVGGGGSGGGLPATLPDPTFELLTEASEVPIQTHPDWATIGTPANGAVIDENGIFIEFDHTSDYVGISTFFSPTVVWRESGFRTSKPSAAELNEVGHLDTPSGAQTPPSATSPRAWLLRAFNYTYEGQIYRYQKEWLLSGRAGPPSGIYT